MIEAILRRGTLLTVIALVVLVLGLLAASRVPVQMIPDLAVRTISVQTSWPGATPQDVEKEILVEQEEFLRALPNLQRMVSYARTGTAEVELEFPFNVNVLEAQIEVNNALSQVPEYPENVNQPRVTATSFSENAFMYFRVTPRDGNPQGLDIDLMRDFIDDNVRTRMERVEGVSLVEVRGGAERQVQILIDPGALAERGLSMTDVRDAVRSRNRDVSAGDIEAGKRRYLLRTVGRYDDIDGFADTVIARRGDALVRLRDVAEITLDHFEVRDRAFANGQPAITLAVRRVTGSNVIAIKRAMGPVVDSINAEVLAPAGLEMALTSDDVRYVEASVTNVWQNLAIGAVLATIVLLLFLRSVPATLVTVVGVPLCTVASFIGLLAFDRTINVISLAGVAFAIGMTLDNAIVVLEAIERERKKGLDRLAAAVAGVRSVSSAVLASTMTTVLVFAPILFIQEEAGQLYSDIAVAISAAILTSMLVALTLVPAASTRIRFGSDVATRDSALKQRLVGVVGWLVARPVRRWCYLAGVLATLAITLYVLTPPAEYLPEGEEPKAFARMSAPPGYNLQEMLAIGDALQDELLPHVGADRRAFAEGDTDMPPVRYINLSVESTGLRIISETVDPTDIDALMAALTRRYEVYPGMRAFVARGSIISSNDGGTRSVNVDISGPDLASIYAVADIIYRRAESVLGSPQINSDPGSLSLDQPLIEIRPDWARLTELGLDAGEFGFSVAALADGAYVDEFFLGDRKIDIYAYSDAGSQQSLQRLPELPIYTPQGTVVPLSAVADLVDTVDTDQIRRVNGRRTVTLNIIPPRSIALETAVELVQRDVVDALRDEGALSNGVQLDISGASDQLQATQASLTGNFGVALVLSYLLLVAIFVHWGYPLLIMLTVPLGIAGGIAGLAVLNLFIRQPFDMITMLGFLILLGTVVNNPILIVDQARRNLREAGLQIEDAVTDAVRTRVRPIMMSMITTIFGLAPLVFIPGAGTELYRGVGTIVLFGLMVATLLTLTFLPTLLVTIMRLRSSTRRVV